MRNIVFTFCFLLPFISMLTAQQSLGLFYNNPGSLQGYTLISPMTSSTTFLLDNCGERVNSWETDSRPGLMAYLDDEGNLWRTERTNFVFGGGGASGRISKYNWEGDLLWRYDYTSEFQTLHHDIALLPSGNILLLSWDRYLGEEAVAQGRPEDNVGEHLWSEKIVELKPIGTDDAEEVWVWKLWDHLIQDTDSSLPNFGVVADHPERMNINFSGSDVLPTSGQTDWIHFNGIDYNEELDQIVLSSRHVSEILILDHSTTTEEAKGTSGGNAGMGGDFLYRWGNPQGYGTGSTATKLLFGPHNASWVKWGPDEELGVLIYNNGVGRPGTDFSQVDVILLPRNGFNYERDANKPFNPGTPIWSVDQFENETFFSSNVSGAQQLQNGNVLVCVGQDGTLFEVDPATNFAVWKYISPAQNDEFASQGTSANDNNLFRGTRYPMDFPGFIGKDLSPKGLLELNPLPSDCQIISGIDNLLEEKELTLFPNPTTGTITISNLSFQDEVALYDRFGRRQHPIQSGDSNQLNISHLPNGIYFLQVNERAAQRIVLLR